MRREQVGACRGELAGGRAFEGDVMRPELVVDEVFKPVAAFGCSGEPEPVFCGYSVEDVEERAGGDVVAFVDDDETVTGGGSFDVVAACQGG